MAENEYKHGFLPLIVASILAIVVGAALTYIGFFTTVTVGSSADSVLLPTAATGTITFTGNVSQNETVNFTVNSSYAVNFAFNFSNISGIPSGYNYVNITTNYNGSNVASTNLTAAINNNATLVALLTASNVSGTTTNGTLVTYKTTGTAGNLIGTTETVTNGSWGSSTLSGGVVGETMWAGIKTNTNTAFTLTGIIIMLLGVAGLITVLLNGLGKAGQSGRT